MSLEENKAIVRRFLEEGWNEGKLEVFDETVAADCPWGKDVYGPEAVKKNHTTSHIWSPDSHITIEDIIAEGDKVVVSDTTTGTHTGEIEDWPAPEGKEWSIRAISIFTLTGGKISKFEFLQDNFALYTQLGYIPTWKEMMEQAKAKQE
ncbi:MAG: ester cyclase [Planctomycetota bacterium]|jgi:predicted ester cyclase